MNQDLLGVDQQELQQVSGAGADQVLTTLVQNVNALLQSQGQVLQQLQQQNQQIQQQNQQIQQQNQQIQQMQVTLAAIQQQLQGGQPAQQQAQAQLAAQLQAPIMAELQDLPKQVLTPAEKNQIYRRMNLLLDSSTPLMRLVNDAGEVAINHPKTKWNFRCISRVRNKNSYYSY